MIINLRHELNDGRQLVVTDLDMGADERLVIFGPNGAGKTTLLRLLAGTLAGGPDLDAAYLPQRPVALRGTARRNLELGLDAAESDKAWGIAAAFGISDRLEEPARRLSGGHRQRLALARTLAAEAEIVLLDEPLAPIDAADRRSMLALVDQELADRAAIVVTHDRDTAAALGDRVAVLIDGAIHQVGSPGDVFSKPATEDAAAALGVANILSGELIDAGDGLLSLKVGPLVVWGMGGAPAVGRAVFGGEAVTVYTGGHADSGSARNTWPGTVTEVRELGALVEVVVDCGIPIVALLTPGAVDGLGLETGGNVTLAVKATAVSVL